MTTITLDAKMFDYDNIDEPLIAVPISFLNDYKKYKVALKIPSSRKIKHLSASDILRGGDQALKEYKAGKLKNWREIL